MPKPVFNSLAEVQELQQADKDKVIIVVKQGVYDVTEYLPNHPGGPTPIMMANGKDATKAFQDAEHPEEAVMQMEDYRIGTLKAAAAATTPAKAGGIGAQQIVVGVAFVAVAALLVKKFVLDK